MKRDKPTTRDRVCHVLEAIANIEEFTQHHDRDSFDLDVKTVSACLFMFSIIGEATSHIETEILDRYPYPWHKVKSFRNFILHEYFGIELRLVWDTAKHTLPELKRVMEMMLKNEF